MTFIDAAAPIAAHAALTADVHGTGVGNDVASDADITTHAGIKQNVHGVGANDIADVADISTHAAVTTNVHGTGAGNVIVGNDEITGFSNGVNANRTNMALVAFKAAVNGSLVRFALQNGIIDDFQDNSGILSGGNVSGNKLTFSYDAIVPTAATNSDSEANVLSKLTDNDLGVRSMLTATSGWWDFNYNEARKVEKYDISGYTATARLIKNWTLKGSNTGAFSGEETLIDTQVNQVFGSSETKSYICDTPGSFQYYRIVVTANNGDGSYTEIAELDTYQIYDAVISNSATAKTQPSNIHTVILADDTAITLNTDLKLYVSVDNGGTWEQVTLTDTGDYAGSAKILTGSEAIIGTGTTIKYKIECPLIDFEFYSVGLIWD